MSNNYVEDDIYIIPHNYKDNGKIFGLIEKKSVITAAIWFIPTTYINFAFLPIPLNIRLFTFVLFVCPPTIFALIGIGNDTLVDFVKYLYNYYKRAKVYLHEK